MQGVSAFRLRASPQAEAEHGHIVELVMAVYEGVDGLFYGFNHLLGARAVGIGEARQQAIFFQTTGGYDYLFLAKKVEKTSESVDKNFYIV